MDFMTLIGITAGVIFTYLGIASGGELAAYYNPASIAITLGGTLAATLIHYPFSQIARIAGIVAKTFTSRQRDPEEGIQTIVRFAITARKEGLLTLERLAEELDDSFLKKGIMQVVDGTSPELVKSMLETELAFIEERHKQGQGILESMAGYAPAFGMIGTLIGLINMLRNLDEPSALGPAMAVALVTTFYGTILANLILLPMAGKLKTYSAQELLYKEMILEGILSIQAGENPRIIEEKLRSFTASPGNKRQDQARREVREVNA